MGFNVTGFGSGQWNWKANGSGNASGASGACGASGSWIKPLNASGVGSASESGGVDENDIWGRTKAELKTKGKALSSGDEQTVRKAIIKYHEICCEIGKLQALCRGSSTTHYDGRLLNLHDQLKEYNEQAVGTVKKYDANTGNHLNDWLGNRVYNNITSMY